MDNQDYRDSLLLLDIFGKVLDSNKHFTITNKSEWYMEGLANKTCNHAFFAHYIATNRNILTFPWGNVELSGIASIDVLAIFTYESFLTFHYVFFQPKDNEKSRNLRFESYLLAGLLERQDFPAVLEEHKKILFEERNQIEELRGSLKTNSIFQKLELKQQKDLLKGKWRLSPWRTIAESAKLTNLIAEHMYRNLSGYAHSSCLSVLQIKEAHEKHEENIIIGRSILVDNIVMANTIYEYAELLPKAKAYLSNDISATRLVNTWIELGQKVTTK